MVNRWHTYVSQFLTHWGRVTHICVGEQTIIVSDNGLLPGRRQAIICTNDGILLIGPYGTNFSEIGIEILTFSLMKMSLKVLSAKWQPFCLGLNVLMDSCDPFSHIPQGCSTGTAANVGLLQCQWSNPEGYGWNPNFPNHKRTQQIVNYVDHTLTEWFTHWGWDKMPAVSQTAFSNAFSWMKMYEFRLRFHWCLFLMFQLTLFQHWFR